MCVLIFIENNTTLINCVCVLSSSIFIITPFSFQAWALEMRPSEWVLILFGSHLIFGD